MPSYTHAFHSCFILWQISSERKEFLLRERTWKNTGTRAKASTSGLSTRGRAYLKFELQSKIKVDKTFVHCHRRKEKHKWLRTALYLFLHILREKDFPDQSIFAKFISGGTLLLNQIFARFYPGVPKRKSTQYDMFYYFLLNNSRYRS